MRRSSPLPLIIGVVFVLACLGGILTFMFWPKFTITVNFENLGKLQTGDKLYMKGMVIGNVKKVALDSSGKGVVQISINKEHKPLLNESTRFTIASDRLITGRKCLLCKNCGENVPAVESGHAFNGSGRLQYELACVQNQAEKSGRDIWETYLREMVEQSLEISDQLSNEVLDKLKEFEEKYHEEFMVFYEQLKKDWENIKPEIRKQLDELLSNGQESKQI